MIRNSFIKFASRQSGWPLSSAVITDLRCICGPQQHHQQQQQQRYPNLSPQIRCLKKQPLTGYHYPPEVMPWQEPRRDFYEFYRADIEHEPPKDIRDGIPIHAGVGVKISGYDQCVVDHYSQYIHRLAQQMDIVVKNCYPLPTRIIQVMSYQATSKQPAEVHHLKKSIRVVHLYDVKSTVLSVFVQAISRHVPEGTELSVNLQPEEDEQSRYRTMDEMLILIPD